MSTIGVPIKLLHEAQGHIITLELKTGQLYRGKLVAGNNQYCPNDESTRTLTYLYFLCSRG